MKSTIEIIGMIVFFICFITLGVMSFQLLNEKTKAEEKIKELQVELDAVVMRELNTTTELRAQLRECRESNTTFLKTWAEGNKIPRKD